MTIFLLLLMIQPSTMETKEWYICSRSKEGVIACDKKTRLNYKEADSKVKALNAKKIQGFHFWIERPKHRRGK